MPTRSAMSATGPSSGAAIRMKRKDAPQIAASTTSSTASEVRIAGRSIRGGRRHAEVSTAVTGETPSGWSRNPDLEPEDGAPRRSDLRE